MELVDVAEALQLGEEEEEEQPTQQPVEPAPEAAAPAIATEEPVDNQPPAPAPAVAEQVAQSPAPAPAPAAKPSWSPPKVPLSGRLHSIGVAPPWESTLGSDSDKEFKWFGMDHGEVVVRAEEKTDAEERVGRAEAWGFMECSVLTMYKKSRNDNTSVSDAGIETAGGRVVPQHANVETFTT